MIKRILKAKDPALRQVSKPVAKLDKKVLQVVKDLQNTLKKQTDPPGVGLAAPQIGVFLRILSVANGKQTTIFINPEVTETSKRINDPLKKDEEDFNTAKQDNLTMEGCLSLPNFYGPVVRSEKITIRYQTPKKVSSQWILVEEEKTFSGFPAQVIQHELDHLEGILFIDRLLEQKKGLFVIKNNEWHEVNFP